MKIRFDQAPIPQSNWFCDPQAVIRAQTPDDIEPAFAALAVAREAGLWVAGFCSYELGYALEPKLAPFMPQDRSVPLLQFGVYERPMHMPDPAPQPYSLGAFTPHWSQADYATAFHKVKGFIAAGDVYQINLTFPLSAEFSGDTFSAYAALEQRQEVRHGAFIDLEDGRAVLSRSPELFFKTSAAAQIETLPMKGTQPRHLDPALDMAAREFLHTDSKNRAENLMIVDLLRNDISRVCKMGSVKVPELFRVDTYATLHQMVSRITGDLADDVSVEHILRALFPCGSITGAPKVRAMEIIQSLETAARDLYCGAIGWIAPDGTSEFSVAIRTIFIENGVARLNVGGGVVYDSNVSSEYEEALWKARFANLSPPIAA
jgi:para-aminobenzoate synthetase component 1